MPTWLPISVLPSPVISSVVGVISGARATVFLTVSPMLQVPPLTVISGLVGLMLTTVTSSAVRITPSTSMA